MGDAQSLSLPGISTPLLPDELTGQKSIVCEVNTRKDHLPVIGKQNVGDEAFRSLCALESAITIPPYMLRNRLLSGPGEGGNKR